LLPEHASSYVQSKERFAMRVPQPDDRHHVLNELREAIRQIERRPARRGGVVPCGLAEIDAALPGGGFPRGAICELAGGRASGKTALALSVLASLGEKDVFAWVDGRGEIYPPAAAARGVDLGRLLIVRPGAASPFRAYSRSSTRGREHGIQGSDERAVHACLWAAEALLGSTAFAAVVMDVPLRHHGRGWDAIAHRLQTAAERGGAVGLWLTSPRAAVRIPAALRLELLTEGGRVVARRTQGEVALERRNHVA
jgi:protein ImuA